MHPSQNPAHNFYEKALYKTENNSFPSFSHRSPRAPKNRVYNFRMNARALDNRNCACRAEAIREGGSTKK